MTANDEAYYFAFMNKIRILFSNATKHVKKTIVALKMRVQES